MAKHTVHNQWMDAQRLLKEAKRAAGIEKKLEELKERYGFFMTRQVLGSTSMMNGRLFSPFQTWHFDNTD